MSGSVSVVIVDKNMGLFCEIKTIGVGSDENIIDKNAMHPVRDAGSVE
jgi:hypothetical protein